MGWYKLARRKQLKGKICMSNYPAGFNGLEGEEEELYLFEINGEFTIDAESEKEALEMLKEFKIHDLTDVYEKELEDGMNRYLFDLYGELEIWSTSEGYAEEEFKNMTVEEALGNGLMIN